MRVGGRRTGDEIEMMSVLCAPWGLSDLRETSALIPFLRVSHGKPTALYKLHRFNCVLQIRKVKVEKKNARNTFKRLL